MLALGIVLAVLLLLMLIPVGVRMSYLGGVFTLQARIGPFHLQLFPKKEKKPDKKPQKKKAKANKPKTEESAPSKPKKAKKKLTLDDILTLVRLGLQALSRFRRHLHLDILMLHVTVAAPDPYDTATRYGYLNSALASLLPLLHRVVKVGKEDIGTAMDFSRESPDLEAELQAAQAAQAEQEAQAAQEAQDAAAEAAQ